MSNSGYIPIGSSNSLEVGPANPTVEAVTIPVNDVPLSLPPTSQEIRSDVNNTGFIINTMA
ncbi:MAG: hypothetical protein ACNI3A_12085 [Desulfovibrio sp.]|uniref:hypothetical protein n=1 Tax=Desulfovibrio sp. 7SRBS1 TaxID=3378064 RepID=UPI003B3D02DA